MRMRHFNPILTATLLFLPYSGHSVQIQWGMQAQLEMKEHELMLGSHKKNNYNYIDSVMLKTRFFNDYQYPQVIQAFPLRKPDGTSPDDTPQPHAQATHSFFSLQSLTQSVTQGLTALLGNNGEPSHSEDPSQVYAQATPSLSASMLSSMTQSIIQALPASPLDAENIPVPEFQGLSDSIIAQTLDGSIEVPVDSTQFPFLVNILLSLSPIVQNEGTQTITNAYFSTSASFELLSELNLFCKKQDNSDLSSINKKNLKKWLRWVKSSFGISILVTAFQDESLAQLQNQIVPTLYNNYFGVRRLIALLNKLDVPGSAIVKIITDLLTQMIEGTMGVPLVDQPLTVIIAMLSQSQVAIEHYTQHGLISFDYEHLNRQVSSRRSYFRPLLSALDQINVDIEPNAMNRTHLSDYLFHVIKHENEFLKQFCSYSCYVPPREFIQDLLTKLNAFASSSAEESSELAASALISMIHMPCLIDTLHYIFEENDSQHILNALRWLKANHSRLLDLHQNGWQATLLQATLLSLGFQIQGNEADNLLLESSDANSSFLLDWLGNFNLTTHLPQFSRVLNSMIPGFSNLSVVSDPHEASSETQEEKQDRLLMGALNDQAGKKITRREHK